MRRFLGYYRQFEELSPEEVSRDLRRRRDEEKAQSLTETPALDLSSPAWHEPPHAEIVNAATFALRRAVRDKENPGTIIGDAARAVLHVHDIPSHLDVRQQTQHRRLFARADPIAAAVHEHGGRGRT